MSKIAEALPPNIKKVIILVVKKIKNLLIYRKSFLEKFEQRKYETN